jgi:hypothetical protein
MPETNTLPSLFFPILGFYLAERQGCVTTMRCRLYALTN